MRKTIILTLALALAASAQKIETERADRNRVIRLQTVPNHLSIIELAEPVIAHRLAMEPQAKFSGLTARGVVQDVLKKVPSPT